MQNHEQSKYLNKNVLLLLENKTIEFGDKVALSMKSYLGWQELSFKGLGILAKRLANYLMKIGINKGDKVAILSESMPEWGATLFGSILSGAIVVPLDIKLTIYEWTSILSDCMPKVLLVSSTYFEKALELKELIPSIENIVIIDDKKERNGYPGLYDIEESTNIKWRHRAPSKTALIIYTSGTTGSPKGVEITFNNIVSQLESISAAFNFGPQDRMLSILPMNHLFELTVGFLSFLNFGTSIYYSKSLKPKDLFKIFQEKQITFMISVPAFAKLLKTTIESEIAQRPKWQQFCFNVKYEMAKFVPFKAVKRLMFKDIHKHFGGKFKGILSGGAPLDLNVGKFFNNIGITIWQGYGLTETSPLISVETQKAHRFGSVGKVINSVKAKVDPQTGELLVTGDGIMKGYYNKPELTAETITPDGWLHTGDIAKIDKDGFLFITGRIKNMIVLSGGKKVFPEEVESVIEKSEKFTEICVFGATRQGGQKDGSEDVCIAVVPTEDFINSCNGDKALIEKEVKAEVKLLSQRLAPYKRPLNVYVTYEPLPRTATRKVKRRNVKELVLQ